MENIRDRMNRWRDCGEADGQEIRYIFVLPDGFTGDGDAVVEAGIGRTPFNDGFSVAGSRLGTRGTLGKGTRGASTAGFPFDGRLAVGPEAKDDRMGLLAKTGEEENGHQRKCKHFL